MTAASDGEVRRLTTRAAGAQARQAVGIGCVP